MTVFNNYSPTITYNNVAFVMQSITVPHRNRTHTVHKRVRHILMTIVEPPETICWTHCLSFRHWRRSHCVFRIKLWENPFQLYYNRWCIIWWFYSRERENTCAGESVVAQQPPAQRIGKKGSWTSRLFGKLARHNCFSVYAYISLESTPTTTILQRTLKRTRMLLVTLLDMDASASFDVILFLHYFETGTETGMLNLVVCTVI